MGVYRTGHSVAAQIGGSESIALVGSNQAQNAARLASWKRTAMGPVSYTHLDVYKRQRMGFSTSIVVVAIGAILRFAVSVTTTGFNLHTIGLILMIVGIVSLVLSIMFWNSWGCLLYTSRCV